MSDHEFEKQVHQKLQELKLRPSDGVWMEVEKSIRPGKDRRRIIWWWMAALLVGLTAGGIVLYNYIVDSPAATAAVAKTEETTPTQSTNKPAETATNSSNTNSVPQHNQQEPGVASAVATTPEPAAAEKNTITNTTINKNSKPVQQPLANNSGNTNTVLVEPVNTTRLSHEKLYNRKKKAARETILLAETTPVQPETMTVVETAQVEPDALNIIMPARINNPDSAIVTNKAVITMPFKTMAQSMMANTGSAVGLATAPLIRKKPTLWHWGVTADAGYSRIAESKLFQLRGLLGKDKYYAEDLSARSNATPSTSNNLSNFNSTPSSQMVSWSAYTAPPKKASPIQADKSFSLGMFVQHTVSRRLKLTLGIEYAYLSVHTEVGQKVNAANNPVVVNLGTSQAALVKEYYKYPGSDTAQSISAAVYAQGTAYSQKYTYRFHYFEIPLTASWQINKGRKLPPFQLEGGISMARLLSVDALHYEGIKGIYYKDNDLFNKTQFNFVAGLSAGLLQQSRHPLWIGPSLRYSLNGLVNKEVSTGQYAWTAGISIKVLLGKL